MSELTVQYEHEYPADLAGQRIGWMSLTEKRTPHDDTYFALSAALAEVSEEGAMVRSFANDEGTELYTRDSVRGFLDAAAVEVVLVPDLPHDLSNAYFATSDNPKTGGYGFGQASTANQLIVAGTGRATPTSRARTWAHTEEDLHQMLTAGVKEALDDKGLADEGYPVYYYLLNAMLLNEHFMAKDPSPARYALDRALPDVRMHEQTTSELRLAQKVAGLFGRQFAANTHITEILEDQSIAKLDKTLQFVDARELAAELEREAVAAQSKATVPYLWFSSEGNANGRARSWWFMSALAGNTPNGYENVLERVKSGDYGFAIHELERESYELSSRLTAAMCGVNGLRRLSKAEVAAVAETMAQ